MRVKKTYKYNYYKSTSSVNTTIRNSMNNNSKFYYLLSRQGTCSHDRAPALKTEHLLLRQGTCSQDRAPALKTGHLLSRQSTCSHDRAPALKTEHQLSRQGTCSNTETHQTLSVKYGCLFRFSFEPEDSAEDGSGDYLQDVPLAQYSGDGLLQ